MRISIYICTIYNARAYKYDARAYVARATVPSIIFLNFFLQYYVQDDTTKYARWKTPPPTTGEPIHGKSEIGNPVLYRYLRYAIITPAAAGTRIM